MAGTPREEIEDRLIEYDRVLRRWVCIVCAGTWARSVHGEAMRIGRLYVSRWPEMRLPGGVIGLRR